MDVKLYKAKVESKDPYSKSLRLSTGDVSVALDELPISYEKYVSRLKAYFLDDYSEMAKLLGVEEVARQGQYIRGVFGGEKKKGKKKYAGLAVESKTHDDLSQAWRINFYGMGKHVEVPDFVMKKYSVRFYKLIYINIVHPFNVGEPYDIVLSGSSKDGDKELKGFIKEVKDLNTDKLEKEEEEKLATLAEEAVQPSSLQTLQRDSYYVIYRGKRTFSAGVFRPSSDDFVAESSVAYINCGNDEGKAYFYAAALNYLAYKAVKLRKRFVRNLYGKPVMALIAAGLAWDEFAKAAGQNKLAEVVELSKALHGKTPRKKYEREGQAFKDLEGLQEFRRLVKIFDDYVGQNRINLDEALSFAAT